MFGFLSLVLFSKYTSTLSAFLPHELMASSLAHSWAFCFKTESSDSAMIFSPCHGPSLSRSSDVSLAKCSALQEMCHCVWPLLYSSHLGKRTRSHSFLVLPKVNRVRKQERDRLDQSGNNRRCYAKCSLSKN